MKAKLLSRDSRTLKFSGLDQLAPAELDVVLSYTGDADVSKGVALDRVVIPDIITALRNSARYEWLMDHASSMGGGTGETVTVRIPFDHEDTGCAIDMAIAAEEGT